MSIAGRNAIHGSTVTVYRPARTEGSGGQTTVAWSAALLHLRLELHARTDEMIRRVYGVDSQVELVAYVAADTDVQGLDALVVTQGAHSGSVFRVVRTMRSRKYLELGLQRMADGQAVP